VVAVDEKVEPRFFSFAFVFVRTDETVRRTHRVPPTHTSANAPSSSARCGVPLLAPTKAKNQGKLVLVASLKTIWSSFQPFCTLSVSLKSISFVLDLILSLEARKASYNPR